MKTKNFFFILFLTCCITGWSENRPELAAFLVPDSLTENAEEVVRLEQKEFYIKSNKEGVLSHKKVITLYSKDSGANVLVVPYDKDTKVGKIKARIYDALGNLIRKIESSEIKDVAAIDGFSIAQDDRLKYFEIRHSSYPYTLEYEYEQTLRGAYYHIFPDWHIQEYYSAIQVATFTINIPAESKFYHKVLNLDVEPEISRDANRKSYTWAVANLKAVEYEPFSPMQSAILPQILFSPDQFTFAGYKGSMASWQSYGKFMNELYEGKDQLPQELATEIRALTANAKTERDKIEILYRYMQENMRYVSVQLGIGGWQPFDATYVNKNKYGDCKALTNFMKAMLKEVGIVAYPVLIKNGRRTYEITPEYTTPKFNHVILNIPSEDCWLECTSQNYPVNYIGSGNMDRNVLLVNEDGGKIIRTPVFDENDNTRHSKVSIHLNADGSAELSSSIRANGEQHEILRAMEKQLSQKEREDYLKESSSLPSFSINKLAVTSSPKLPEAYMDYELEIPRFASKAGKRLFVPVNSINPYSSVPKPLENRKFPVIGRKKYTEADTINIQIPEGYQIESIPASEFSSETDYVHYEMKIKKTQKGIQYSRKLQMKAFELPPKEYANFREVLKEIAKKDKMKIVLVQKKT